MSFFRKYRLLIWKNFLLQKRRPKSTLLEIFLPIFFIFILLVLRVTSIQAKFVDAYNHWQAFSINGSSFNMKSHMGTWVIAYTPNDTKHTKIMEHAKKFAPNIEVEGFYNEKMLVDKVVSDENKMFNIQRYLCGVVFDDKSDNKQVIKYALRFPANPRQGSQKSKLFPSKWYTEFVFPFTFEGLGPRTKKGENAYLGGPPPYYLDGFLDVQKIVDFGIIGMENKSFIDLNIDTSMQRHPYPARIEDPFIIVIQNSFPMLLMLSLVYTALSIVRNIVYEKEKKLKESMKMMGLCGWLHWFAWFTKCFIFLLIPLIVITILMTVKFGDGNGKMLKESDGFLVFIFLILYAIASIMFCFFVSTLFYRANIAAAAGGIFWFLSYVPYFFLFNYYQQMSLTSKVLACLDFQIAMAFGANLIGRFEGSGAGVQWSNLSEGVTVDDTFTFGQVLGMLVLDSFLYGFLTWYIEGIFPGEYGIPKKWYFPLSRKYWCDVQDVENEALIDVDEENDIEVSTPADFIEKEPDNIDCGIKIVNLVKQFKTDSGTKVAVNDLNLNLYEGKITALLGHNGAGKTTTISMLTGLIPPTSGNAFINGHDIINNMASIRSSLGICPQHNVLFDSLTVKEHLWFFTCLKGSTDKDEINKEVTNMIKSLELVDKTNVPSSNLSGGMKRKLSVGIALVGKSKVVILDEPTSGMDVSARRFTWDLLQRERKERTILLTTHFMDEADVLGDRIAIMSSGKIKCCGSSLFLKKKFGVGYHMVMVKEPDCDVTKVSDVITKHIPTAQLESNVGLELSFILPSEFSHKFEELFTEIESERSELKISSYGASVTTLEEVFLKVGEEENVKIETHKKLFRQLSGKDNTGFSSEEDQALPDHRPSSRMLNSSGSFTKPPVVKNQGFRLSFQRWYAMFVKRCIHSKRHKISLISQLLMPSLFVMLALIVVKTMPKAADSPSRDLTLTMFGENKVPILLQSRSIFSNKMESAFKHYLNNKGDPEFLDPDENMTVYLMDKENVDLARFNRKNLVAIEMDGEEGNVQATCFFNNEALHSPAVSLNVFSNALLQYFTGEKEIKTLNHPLPTTTSQSIKDLTANPNGFQIGFSLCFGMSFLASSFIVFLVQERSTKAKHVQFVSGVDPISYWTSAYLWDLINYLLPTVVIILLFFIFQIDAFQGERVGYVLLLLLLYGWAIIPMMYMFSFAFMVASTAYTRMTILNVITGLAMLLVLFILNIPALDLLDVAKVLNWVFLLFPNFNLGQGVIDIFNNFNIIKTYNEAMEMALRECKQFPPPFQHICEEKAKELIANMTSELPNYETNYLAWQTPGIGRYLIFLTLEGFIFFGLVLMIEAGYFNWVSKVIKFIRCPRCCKRTVTMTYATGDDGNQVIDSDVYNEQVRITNNEYGTNNVLVLKNLYKVFKTSQGNLTAVDKLSLAVPHGECFGLLGQNGAGKTTTFKILTGDETPTSGSAYVDRFEVSRDLAKVRQRIGYCPQFDALIDLMTGREMLVMYSRLRGVPEHDISELVERLAVNLGVDQYIDKLSKTYSGGNKRKLSTAIALAGDPPLIFLDEPSSGMDPMARRNLWDSISKFIADGKSVIITSHSMEECEALCTRLAIMVNGQFKCLGSPQHLKTKFGDGYTLIARVGGGDTEALKRYINETYPGSILKDEHQGYIHYQLKTDKSWANLFGVMERAKVEYDIEDYSQNKEIKLFTKDVIKYKTTTVKQLSKEPSIASANVGETQIMGETHENQNSKVMVRNGAKVLLHEN